MANTYTNLLYHIVFSTKHRKNLITPQIRDDLYSYIGGIIRGDAGSLLEIGGIPDHVHLVTRFRSEPSVATMIKTLKAKSSKWVNQEREGRSGFAWQTGYGAFTISPSQLKKVISYVQTQEEHHSKTTFKEEYIKLLQRHEIEYDERYVFD